MNYAENILNYFEISSNRDFDSSSKKTIRRDGNSVLSEFSSSADNFN